MYTKYYNSHKQSSLHTGKLIWDWFGHKIVRMVPNDIRVFIYHMFKCKKYGCYKK